MFMDGLILAMIDRGIFPVRNVDDRIVALVFWLFCFYGIVDFILVRHLEL
jgi:hypothetical protein